ncbi:MAG: hypothetical protein AB7I30_08265 [Isosphaeraceae bacterium]
MTNETTELARLAEAVGALREEVARLADRVGALETDAGLAASAREVALREEVVVVIAAAVAAYLGKRARVRQIRLLGSHAWGLQGRVTIQASHKRPAHD